MRLLSPGERSYAVQRSTFRAQTYTRQLFPRLFDKIQLASLFITWTLSLHALAASQPEKTVQAPRAMGQED